MGDPGGEFGGFEGAPRHSPHAPRRGSVWSSERSGWCKGGGRAARPRVPLEIPKCAQVTLGTAICSLVPYVLPRTPRATQTPKYRPRPPKCLPAPSPAPGDPRVPRGPPTAPPDPRRCPRPPILPVSAPPQALKCRPGPPAPRGAVQGPHFGGPRSSPNPLRPLQPGPAQHPPPRARKCEASVWLRPLQIQPRRPPRPVALEAVPKGGAGAGRALGGLGPAGLCRSPARPAGGATGEVT